MPVTTVTGELALTGASPAGDGGRAAADADPITTEVLRHGLTSVAEQMRITLRRTAFSPTIYESMDFACALFDRDVRLLAEAPGIPSFLGTMEFCVQACVDAVGGPDQIEEGDVIFNTYGYDVGSHPQDAAMVMPAFLDGELVGYAALKAHLMDLAAKDMYCTDTTDNFQEGAIFPGVKLYRRGELNEEMLRTIVANSRVPQTVRGDLDAETLAVRMAVSAFTTLIERHGKEVFAASVDRMFAHGEAVMRGFVRRIPDGVYRGGGTIDSNGVQRDPIPFELSVEVAGGDVVVDFTQSPPEQGGPANCPLPTTVSMSRLAVLAVTGFTEPLNEGYLRPIAVRTKPGTMYHPTPPAPVYLCHWAASQALDTIIQMLGQALPEQVQAAGAGDPCAFGWYGRTEDGGFWLDGGTHVGGQGATAHADGPAPMGHLVSSGQRNTPAEAVEARSPIVFRRVEIARDSGGPGRHRGGPGLEIEYELRADAFLISTIERTIDDPLGVAGGGNATSNMPVKVTRPDGSVEHVAKVTGLPTPAGTRFMLRTGGGGGFGPPADRDPAAVHEDIRQGYVSEERARADYPHAFAAASGKAI